MQLTPLRRPTHDRQPPIRLTPRHGPPRCILEQFAQHIWKNKLAWYVAIIVTVILVLQVGLGPALHDWVYG